MLEGAILGLGAGLGGLLGAVGQSLRKPFHAGRFEGGRLPGHVRGLEAAGWSAFVAFLLMAYGREGGTTLWVPLLLVAGIARADEVVRRLDLLEPGELVQLAFALTLGLGACALGIAGLWLDRPPADAAPGLIGLLGELVPGFAAVSLLSLILVVLAPRERRSRGGVAASGR